MRKIAVGLVSAVAGGTMLLSGGTAVAATKAPKVEIVDVKPNPVVVKGDSTTVARFKVDKDRRVRKIEFRVEPADRKTARSLRTKKEVKRLRHWHFAVPFTAHDPEGKWRAIAIAFDRHGKRVAHDTTYFDVRQVRVKADTRVSFNASPSKVRKGKAVSLTGRLQYQHSKHSWRAVRGEKVHIYFRANGTKTWKWVDSDRTDRWGKFSAKERVHRSGAFKAVFKGDRKLDDATSRTDYVRVYNWRR